MLHSFWGIILRDFLYLSNPSEPYLKMFVLERMPNPLALQFALPCKSLFPQALELS